MQKSHVPIFQNNENHHFLLDHDQQSTFDKHWDESQHTHKYHHPSSQSQQEHTLGLKQDLLALQRSLGVVLSAEVLVLSILVARLKSPYQSETDQVSENQHW